MNTVIQTWLEDYKCVDRKDYEQALKEIIQHLSLLGLSRGGFFEDADFYGGTALRIFHNLQRFSEDLDFTLKKSNENFKLRPYFKYIETELNAYGFNVKIDDVIKSNLDSTIESAFLKVDTKIHLLKIKVNTAITDRIQNNEALKIKFEIDINPALSYENELLPLLRPSPFVVGVLKLSSLFAGKMHALLYRNWKTRIKGRDFYDFIYYISRNIPVNLSYLEEKMKMSGDWPNEKKLTREDLLKIYINRIETVDFSNAIQDVSPFIKDQRELSIWNKEFFKKLAVKILVD